MSDNNIHNINDKNNKPNSNHQPKKQTVNIDETTVLECSECGSAAFVPAKRFGVLSAVHPKNPTGQHTIVTFATHVCAKCGAEANFE